VYDQTGQLTAKSAVADLSEWMHVSHGAHTPWGAEDTRPLVAVVETALEHQLSVLIMHGGAKPELRRLPAGALLTEQGAAADDLYLLLDGLIGVSVDGKDLGELGPGAVIGERAILEGAGGRPPSGPPSPAWSPWPPGIRSIPTTWRGSRNTSTGRTRSRTVEWVWPGPCESPSRAARGRWAAQ